MERKYKIVLFAFMAIALAASFYIIVQRASIEQNDKNADIAVEWSQVRDYGQRQGFTPDEALDELQGKVTAIIFKEQLFTELLDTGRVTAYSAASLRLDLAGGRVSILNENRQALTADDIALESNYYTFNTATDLENVVWNLRAKRLGDFATCTIEENGQSFPFLVVNFPISSLSTVGMGFDSAAMEKVISHGFHIVPQFRSWPSYQQGDMENLLKPLQAYPISAVLFNDSSLPAAERGDKELTAAYKDIAAGIAAVNAPVGTIEFLEQKGMTSLARSSKGNVIRLHVAADNEMSTLTPQKALNRYLLAVKERNIRILFIKFFNSMDFNANVDFISDVGGQLQDAGFTLGKPTVIDEIHNHPIVTLLIGLGVVAGGIYLMDLLRLRKAGLVLAALVLLAAAGLIVLGRQVLAAKALALLAALIFPSLAVYSHAGERRSLGKALLAFVSMTAISLVGAAYVVGLLGFQSFMLHENVFTGTKLALGGPILFLFLIFLIFKENAHPWERTQQLYKEPVRYGYLIIAAVFSVVILIFLLRSGNDGMSVSNFEVVFRAKLESLLVVRPRTKEFLLGHPAMLLALYYGYKDKTILLWVVGAIGQVSIINTFSHIHTPVLISFLRTVNAVWIGLLLGLLVLGVVLLVNKYCKKKIKGNGVL